MLDNPQHVQRLGIVDIQQNGPLHKGFGGFPALHADKMVHQRHEGFLVRRIFRHLLHKPAHDGRILLGLLHRVRRLHHQVRILEAPEKSRAEHDGQPGKQKDHEQFVRCFDRISHA